MVCLLLCVCAALNVWCVCVGEWVSEWVVTACPVHVGVFALEICAVATYSVTLAVLQRSM